MSGVPNGSNGLPQKPAPIAQAWARFSGIHTVWIMAALLVAFAQMIILKGSPLWLLPVVMMPPSFAVLFASSPTTSRMGRVAAGTFLALISIGEVLAYCPSIFPGMGEHKGLPVPQDRLIAWYLFAFVMFVFVVWPPMLFGDHLWRRLHGDASAFSLFTCCLGIGAWLLMGPATVWGVAPHFLKQWQ